LSGAVAALFALNGAASLITGEVILPESFMSSFKTDQFVPIFGLSELGAAVNRQVHSAKLMANVFVSPGVESRAFRALDGTAKLRHAVQSLGEHAETVLGSQFITPAALEAGLAGNVQSFLELRGDALLEAARRLAS
jgi:hypothetical protein